MLHQLVELSAAANTVNKKKLKGHVTALMQTDKLQVIQGNGGLLMLCSQCLCDALWQAADKQKLDYTGPLANMYRSGVIL